LGSFAYNDWRSIGSANSLRNIDAIYTSGTEHNRYKQKNENARKIKKKQRGGALPPPSFIVAKKTLINKSNNK
jgi:hypothetical protein